MALSEPRSTWTHRPPDGDTKRAWRMRRAPDSGKLRCVVLSHDLVGLYTHFWGGRTVPHTDGSCKACDAGQRSRWHGYLCAWDLKFRERIIIEITATAVPSIDSFFREHRTLRGSIIELSRVGSAKNGRVRLELKRSDYPADKIPEAAQLQPILLRMWGCIETPQEIGEPLPQELKIVGGAEKCDGDEPATARPA